MKLLICSVLTLGCVAAWGNLHRSWDQSYQAGVDAAKAGNWRVARQDFMDAEKDRAVDSPRPTVLPGSPTEPVTWRSGSLYSPNFLAAYCAYRLALEAQDLNEQGRLLGTAATEFQKLVDEEEVSRDVSFLLDVIYSRIGDEAKRQALAARLSKRKHHFSWKVDEEIISPEEVAAINSTTIGALPQTSFTVSAPIPATAPQATAPSVSSPQVRAGEMTTGTTGQQLNPIVPGLGLGGVPRINDKFALVIGETGDKLGTGQVPFATTDAQTVAAGLVSFAGYGSANVVTLSNPKASEILDAAKALAARVPQDGTVMLYYSGPGSCLNSKDYFVGSDAESLNDPESMVLKLDIYTVFMERGARLFTFYEVNRPIVNGFYFGSEVPQVGAISQMEATIPDGGVTAIYKNGTQIGLFAQAFIDVLSELRSNRVPIYEFGWQIYNKMRRGNSGTSSGASHQIPTLPVLNNLAADSRF